MWQQDVCLDFLVEPLSSDHIFSATQTGSQSTVQWLSQPWLPENVQASLCLGTEVVCYGVHLSRAPCAQDTGTEGHKRFLFFHEEADSLLAPEEAKMLNGHIAAQGPHRFRKQLHVLQRGGRCVPQMGL